jgi:hypothetical protein
MVASLPDVTARTDHNGGSRSLLITVVGDVFGFVQVPGSLAAPGVA